MYYDYLGGRLILWEEIRNKRTDSKDVVKDFLLSVLFFYIRGSIPIDIFVRYCSIFSNVMECQCEYHTFPIKDYL